MPKKPEVLLLLSSARTTSANLTVGRKRPRDHLGELIGVQSVRHGSFKGYNTQRRKETIEVGQATGSTLAALWYCLSRRLEMNEEWRRPRKKAAIDLIENRDRSRARERVVTPIVAAVSGYCLFAARRCYKTKQE
jgi:hypothetical protein